MSCQEHTDHGHKHGAGCGHQAIQHEGHTDYLHDGHMHHLHERHVDEHRLSVGKTNPEQCTPGHACDAHEQGHAHGPSCGHQAIPHGDHLDYAVEGHLHHVCRGHCDDHGPVQLG